MRYAGKDRQKSARSIAANTLSFT
jgi:hypothetical protein